MKDLDLWNRTYTIKLLWLLLFKTESIWMAWIYQNVIKDNNIKEKQSHTCIFKQILRLRDVTMQWVKIIPGVGSKCRFWTDPWTPFGPLFSFIGSNGTRLTGISLDATVGAFWYNNGWILPPARSPRIEELLYYHLTNTEDELQWRIDGTQRLSFCSNIIYRKLRPSRTEVL